MTPERIAVLTGRGQSERDGKRIPEARARRARCAQAGEAGTARRIGGDRPDHDGTRPEDQGVGDAEIGRARIGPGGGGRLAARRLGHGGDVSRIGGRDVGGKDERDLILGKQIRPRHRQPGQCARRRADPGSRCGRRRCGARRHRRMGRDRHALGRRGVRGGRASRRKCRHQQRTRSECRYPAMSHATTTSSSSLSWTNGASGWFPAPSGDTLPSRDRARRADCYTSMRSWVPWRTNCNCPWLATSPVAGPLRRPTATGGSTSPPAGSAVGVWPRPGPPWRELRRSRTPGPTQPDRHGRGPDRTGVGPRALPSGACHRSPNGLDTPRTPSS
jgi:hypothetical protein